MFHIIQMFAGFTSGPKNVKCQVANFLSVGCDCQINIENIVGLLKPRSRHLFDIAAKVLLRLYLTNAAPQLLNNSDFIANMLYRYLI